MPYEVISLERRDPPITQSNNKSSMKRKFQRDIFINQIYVRTEKSRPDISVLTVRSKSNIVS